MFEVSQPGRGGENKNKCWKHANRFLPVTVNSPNHQRGRCECSPQITSSSPHSCLTCLSAKSWHCLAAAHPLPGSAHLHGGFVSALMLSKCLRNPTWIIGITALDYSFIFWNKVVVTTSSAWPLSLKAPELTAYLCLNITLHWNSFPSSIVYYLKGSNLDVPSSIREKNNNSALLWPQPILRRNNYHSLLWLLRAARGPSRNNDKDVSLFMELYEYYICSPLRSWTIRLDSPATFRRTTLAF